MNPPEDKLRGEVAESAAGIRSLSDEEADAELEQVLRSINEHLRMELERNPPEYADDIEALAAACDAWASLASHAVEEVYAPMSPFPRNRAGWGKKAIRRLQSFAATLRTPLSVAQQGLQASSYSISVGFPWGVSIGFSWP